jgi:hypothetical protein
MEAKFLPTLIFRFSDIVPPVLRIWLLSDYYSVPQLSFSAEGLNHTQPVQLQKIINVQ